MEIVTIPGHGDYPIKVRTYGLLDSSQPCLIFLHGVVSHSEWLKPIAERVASTGIFVVCPDRRGTGLNTSNPGDASSVEALLEDIDSIVRHFSSRTDSVHLAGFCWGAYCAIHYALHHSTSIRSMILAAPAIFPAEDISEQTMQTGSGSAPTETPLVPLDRFTDGPMYENYILKDPLKTSAVSKRFNRIMLEMGAMIAPKWVKLTLPTLILLADQDCLVDNNKTQAAYKQLRAEKKQLQLLKGGHGLQFDAPGESANFLAEWIQSIES